MTALSKKRDAAWAKRYPKHDIKQCMLQCALDTDMEVFHLVLQSIPDSTEHFLRPNCLFMAANYFQHAMLDALLPLCDQRDMSVALTELIKKDQEDAVRRMVAHTQTNYPNMAGVALTAAARQQHERLVEYLLPLASQHQLDHALVTSIGERQHPHNPIPELILNRMVAEGVAVGHVALECVIYHERDDLWALFLPASTPTMIEQALNKMKHNKKNSKADLFTQIHRAHQDRQVLEQELSNILENHHTRKARKI